MNNYETLEIVGICIILAFQLSLFIKTKNTIKVFRTIFPEASKFEIIKVGLLRAYFDLHPRDVLTNLNEYAEESEPKQIEPEENNMLIYSMKPKKFEEDKRIFVDLIRNSGGNRVTDKIVYALNTYLLRNKGVASDFHLIKDVVERNSDTVEDDINQSISLPLYLGLLGTFLGIVVGLFQISGVDFSADPKALDSAISLLLGGVKIAMIASFTGLLLTVIGTGYFFKRAKKNAEDKKNDFYTFIQTDLLPLLNQNINSTLFSLQSNLHKFNEEFKGNVGMLSAVMGKNHEALVAQEKILTTLDNMDIAEFAKANVKVLRELQSSTEKFSEFNGYLANINELVCNTKSFAGTMNEMMGKTNDLQELGHDIVEVFQQNQELMKFLQNHYNSLDDSHQLITQAVNGVGNTLDESLQNLKSFTQERIIEIQNITLKEVERMKEEYYEKWKNLDKLSHLETVSKHLSDMKMSNASQMGSVSNEIKLFSDKMSRAIVELEGIRQDSLSAKISKSLVRIFKKRVA